MGDNELSPHDLHRLRRGAYEFLRRYAALAWEHQDDGDRWEVTLPPDVAALPGHQRFRMHARQEARRLAGAQLYDVCPEITGRAAGLGTAIREERHEEAVTQAGHPSVAATLGIQPPAASGFLRWRDPAGIGYNGRGAPIVACQWGPAAGGLWLVWWADSHAMATGYAAEAREARQYISAAGFLQVFGPLWYDEQLLLRPGGSITRQDRTISGPEPAAADAGPSSTDAGTPGLMLLCTTLATWWLLTCPDAVHLNQQPVSAAEQAADRAAGLRSCQVTVATAASIP